MRAFVVLTTVGTEEQAHLIGRELVARRLAACVNVLPGVRSIYRWQGEICSELEILLLVKTLAGELPAVEQAIKELHSYELPEILAFPAARGDAGFLRWIETSVDKSQPFEERDEEADDAEDPAAPAPGLAGAVLPGERTGAA